MLSKANRVTSAVDYRRIVRTGRRQSGAFTLAYARRSADTEPFRLGVIVAKNVGNAVVRNRVRRRIKAIGWSAAQETAGLDVVIRALPSARAAEWSALEAEVRASVLTLATAPASRSRRAR